MKLIQNINKKHILIAGLLSFGITISTLFFTLGFPFKWNYAISHLETTPCTDNAIYCLISLEESDASHPLWDKFFLDLLFWFSIILVFFKIKKAMHTIKNTK